MSLRARRWTSVRADCDSRAGTPFCQQNVGWYGNDRDSSKNSSEGDFRLSGATREIRRRMGYGDTQGGQRKKT